LSNIFSIEFDHHCQMIYSCGNDGYLVQYDLESELALRKMNQISIIGDINLNHENAVTKLTIDPQCDKTILTSSLDGSIQRWDSRSRSLAGTIQMLSPQNCVQFNPVYPHLFVTSDQNGGILMFDDRKAFGTENTPIRTFATTLSRGLFKGRTVDIPSAVWSPNGIKIGAILNGFYPTIYNMDDVNPICFLTSTTTRHHGYKSIST
jgi:WD40 repeat protein